MSEIIEKVIGLFRDFIDNSTNPNLVIHGMMLVLIVFLLTKRPFKPRHSDKLSKKEEEELIAEWKPITLAPKMSNYQKLNEEDDIVITGSTTTTSTIEGHDKPLINLARSNYLGFIGNKEIAQVAEQTVRKYGVGSCGPRGFYGTIDVHLQLEKKTAQFMKAPEAVLYSSGYATVSSAIPSFAKIGDIIIADRGINQTIQVGLALSRSKLFYFNHNDMADLERILKETAFHSKDEIVRKFVIVEGLYYNYGDLSPLPQIIKLKEQYKFRIVLEESHSVGVLGSTGRGIVEHYGLNNKDVDILCASYGNAFSSGGGFCCGQKEVVYHQRLNGVAYVFSASLPPFLATSAEKAIDLLDQNPKLLDSLHQNTNQFYQGLNKIQGLKVTSLPLSPVIHLQLDQSKQSKSRQENEELLEKIVREALKHDLLLTRAKYVENEKFLPPPSIRVCVNCELSKDQITKSIQIIKDCCEVVFSNNKL
ncbi:serine C-palmitoyltransferase subunit [Tieghemostelium lacteum]|uniref:serine C-palmitoyltransferase n=1 Tax=Tieghemostelium lacteum TaxID=361077 RepID=A0A151Z6A8_TIELA|nr:serine C-palmitoyltransferase subunit [Tieghemostelium lacteum]|eukprot:KYQ89490.1 serine C-palmitoyltransferase subunit [Tieghemostelium lacteum]